MLGKGLVKLFEGGEILETTGMLIFDVLALLVFLNRDIQTLFKQKTVENK